MHAYRAFLASVLILLAAFSPGAVENIKTPFQLVPLWSEEMLKYLTGQRQAACSGVNASVCERLNTGLCEDTAYFRIGPNTAQSGLPFRAPARQTASTNPQRFELRLQGAGYNAVSRVFDYSRGELDALELVFDCSFSGNDACPAERFQVGLVRRIELSVRDGLKKFDLTRVAKVLPDGPIVVPIDQVLKEFLLGDSGSVYQVRAVAECFSVAPSPFEWTFPVYKSPDRLDGAGAVIVRVTPGRGMDLAYRPTGGEEVSFEPDWVQPDWGYTFLMQQTILDRKDDWFQLPPRPFPSTVWIHLPGRREISHLEQGQIYSLTKKVKARLKGAQRTVTLDEGEYIVLNVHERILEIRKEEPFDRPCSETEPMRGRRLQTYLVDLAEVYDADLHLRLRLAYPKGC